ncbi:helix-turn-helix domain-containing protein [Neiella marina]|uniref:Helix-turn-helix domain-containing protein n=1 Tax=Neiella holothuriorum TaxID=2870530 RepID=A0ABS7EFC6_9GAMM|nr:helix-turn-helix transcriptional regulator [Neiella holothuriorum]MBW8190950.1 helix-turn-helix domain-containing protein [Neiella holothuriorum]
MLNENPIPARLKAARKKAKITQKELGVKIGMEESSASGRMNHYEKGRHMPDIGTLRRMAQELNVPLNYFFCDDDLSAEIACAIAKLSTEQQTKLLEDLVKQSD